MFFLIILRVILDRDAWPVPYCIHSLKLLILRERKDFTLKYQTQVISCTPFSWFLNVPAFVNISRLCLNTPILTVDHFLRQSSVNLLQHIFFLEEHSKSKAFMLTLSMTKMEQGTKHVPKWKVEIIISSSICFSAAAGARGLLCAGTLPSSCGQLLCHCPCFSFEPPKYCFAICKPSWKCSVCWRSKVFACLDLVWDSPSSGDTAPSALGTLPSRAGHGWRAPAQQRAAPIYLLL